MVEVGWWEEVSGGRGGGVQLSICLPTADRKKKQKNRRSESRRFIMKIGLNMKTSFNSQQAAVSFNCIVGGEPVWQAHGQEGRWGIIATSRLIGQLRPLDGERMKKKREDPAEFGGCLFEII